MIQKKDYISRRYIFKKNVCRKKTKQGNNYIQKGEETIHREK